MSLRVQSGVTLLEAAVCAGIVAIAAGTALFAVASFGRHLAQPGGAARMAALLAAQQTLRVAQDAWKYGSPGGAPSGSQIIALPATVTTAVDASTSPARITVTVHYTPEPGRNGDSGVVELTGELSAKAPLPGSRVQRPGLIPLPAGAP